MSDSLVEMVEKFMHLADCSDDSVPSRAFRDIVDVVCVGDSITGWNNCDDRSVWISPTYPELLAHELASRKRDLTVVDCGMAGEKSYYAAPFARTFLELFPHSRYFVIGFGANDLGDAYSEIDKLSKEIVGNLDEAVDVVLKARRKPILLNVPHLGNAGITPYVAERHRERRDFFNRSLKLFTSLFILNRTRTISDISIILAIFEG